MAMPLFPRVDFQWDVTLWKLVKSAAWLSGGEPASYETQPPSDAGSPFVIILFHQGRRKVSRWRDLMTARQLLAGLTEACAGEWVLHARSLRSRPTLCDPVDRRPARLLRPWDFSRQEHEWVAVSSSRGSSLPRDWTCVFHISCIGRQVLYHQCHLGSPWADTSDLKVTISAPNLGHEFEAGL